MWLLHSLVFSVFDDARTDQSWLVWRCRDGGVAESSGWRFCGGGWWAWVFVVLLAWDVLGRTRFLLVLLVLSCRLSFGCCGVSIAMRCIDRSSQRCSSWQRFAFPKVCAREIKECVRLPGHFIYYVHIGGARVEASQRDPIRKR